MESMLFAIGRTTPANLHISARSISSRPTANVEGIPSNSQPALVPTDKSLHAQLPIMPRMLNEMKDASRRGAVRMDGPSVNGPRGSRVVIEIPDDDDDEVVAVPKLASSILSKGPVLIHNQEQAAYALRGDASIGFARQPPPNSYPRSPRHGSPDIAAGWEYFNDVDELDQEQLARIMMGDFAGESQAEAGRALHSVTPPIAEYQSSPEQPAVVMETRIECVDTVLMVFPGICRDYVSELYDTISESSDRLIAHILDKMDKGTAYPKARDIQKTLKRKRELDEDEEAARKYGAADRIIPATVGGIRPYM